MWKEYAIEPACLGRSPESFRALRTLFGSEQGRWIARLPKREWRNEVRKLLADWPDGLAKKAAEFWIDKDAGFMFSASGATYDPAIDWLPNALRHHETRPFAKILATANPTSHADVVVPDTQDDLGACLSSPHQISVSRTADALVTAVAPLLAKAQELILIDPNFGPEPRFLDILQGVLKEVARRPQKPSRIEYHFKATVTAAEVLENWAKQIERALPFGFDVSFVAWSEKPDGEKLHDRFILAPIGGVEISVGLDSGKPSQTTRITRLTAKTHDEIWGNYQHATPSAFNLAPGFPVTLPRP